MVKARKTVFVHLLTGMWLISSNGFGCSCDGEEDQREAVDGPAIALAHEDATTNIPLVEPSQSAGEEREQPPRERRAERTVFDLGANRLLAHARVASALHIDAGSPGFSKYVRFAMSTPRWRIGERRDDIRVAVAEESSKHSAAIDVPLSAYEAESFDTMLLRVHAKTAGTWSVKVGGRERANTVAKLKLVQGWQTALVAIPQGRLQAGENMITFGPSRDRHALQWLRLGRAETLSQWLDAADSEALDSPLDSYDTDTRSFMLRRDEGLSFYIYVPESAHLVADVTRANGVQPRTPGDGARSDDSSEDTRRTGDCAVEVHASAPDAAVSDTLEGLNAGVSLESLAGQVVRLDLTAVGCAGSHLSEARITVPDTSEPPTSPGPPPKYVVLWVMDTLRADRVRPFQPDARPEVPTFERLAETGTVFRQYWVQGNESQTSHSSVWTSLYPVNHHVRTAGEGGTWRLSKDFEKLPKQLHEAGFYNIGVTGNGYVTLYGGYGRDFDVWRNVMREGLAVNNNVPSEQILDMGLEYLEEHHHDGPVFMFLGTIDTHKPWIARQPWLERYDPEPYHGIHREAVWPTNLGMVAGSMRCTRVPKERDLQRINAIYDSNVSYQDVQLGRLLDKLEELGIAEQTMLVVTADHGEELWEVGRCGHGGSLRETLVRVPLLVHYPPIFPSRVVFEGAEGVDILPTILDALDRPVLDDAQGHSLVPLAQGVVGGYPMPSYASQYEYAHAMRLANWKARVNGTGVPEIFDMAADPEEKRDLAGERPIARRFLTDAFSLFLVYRDRWKKRDFGVSSNMTERAVCELKHANDRNRDHGDGEHTKDGADSDDAGDNATPSDPCSSY